MAISRFPVFTNRFNEVKGDLSLDKFAQKTGISKTSLGLYASGQRIPDALVLSKIAASCGVSSDYLLGLTDVSSPDPELQATCEYTGLCEEAIQCLNSNKNDKQLLSDFIAEYGNEFLRLLHSIKAYSDDLSIACSVTPSDSQLDINDRFKDRLDLELFRFAKLCSYIPDSLCGAGNAVNQYQEACKAYGGAYGND